MIDVLDSNLCRVADMNRSAVDTLGSVAVTVTVFTTCSGGIGRMDTTIFPENLPAGSHSIPVMYIGTLQFSVL